MYILIQSCVRNSPHHGDLITGDHVEAKLAYGLLGGLLFLRTRLHCSPSFTCNDEQIIQEIMIDGAVTQVVS